MTNTAQHDDRPGGSERSTIVGWVDAALATPPVGLIRIDGTGLSAAAIEGELGPTDALRAIGPGRFLIVRSGMRAPAEAEGLALRLAAGLGDGGAQPVIGVAVSRPEDSADDLLGYVERALTDAAQLGGDRVVFFDDGDRELLVRPDEQGTERP